MSRKCQITGKVPVTGQKVSHANNKTKRRFDINLKSKRVWVESQQRFVKVKVCARGMRTIDKLGIEKFLEDK